MSSDRENGGEFFSAFMDDYFAECDEHLTIVRGLLASAASGGGRLTPAMLEELFRSFHSLKGLSGMVALHDAELLAHHMENYLRLLRTGQASFTERGLDALANATATLERVIAARRSNQPAPSLDVLEELDALAPSAAGAVQQTNPSDGPAPTPEWRAIFTPSPDLASRGINVDRIRARLGAIATIAEARPKIATDGGVQFEFLLEGVAVPPALPEWAADGVLLSRLERGESRPAGVDGVPGDAADAGPLLTSGQFVRVDLARVDELMRMIGDLVISRARLADHLAKLETRVPAAEWRPVQESSHKLERQLRDLREGVMRVRLVPVREIFLRVPLVVRNLARETNRVVDLQLNGQDTEIDKFLVERMLDPVLHLVRNSVGHGIEPVDERRALGKTDAGRLTLSAASVGDIVTLEISDDGRGVDVEAVRRRARTAGIDVADGPLEGAALLKILCAPGFSTREVADRTSGRGVGMDVVLQAIRELGGQLTLDSAPGEGTRFLIELPLTLSITDAIIASAGGQMFAVPQAAVTEVLEVPSAVLRAVEGHELMPYRDGAVPMVRLSERFGLASRSNGLLHVFVIGKGHSAVGVAVDRIQTQREIVVRQLADPLVRVDGVTGATDLGDGRVVLILDLPRVVGSARRSPALAALRPEAAL